MEKLSDKVYVAADYLGNNVGCIITQRGVVLVESPMLSYEAKHWQEEIRKTTDKPILYVINTHHHFDHVIGNCHFECPVIAHKNAIRGMEYLRDNLREEFDIFFPEDKERWEADLLNLRVVFPQITFSRKLFLHQGDTAIEIKFVGGHSSSSIAIYIPSEKIIFTGDNVSNGIHPFMGQARLNTWIDDLKFVLDMDIDIVVPGHGPVGNKDIVRQFQDYLELLRDKVRELKDSGYKAEDMVGELDQVIDFFPVEKKGRSNARKLIAAGISNVYGQV